MSREARKAVGWICALVLTSAIMGVVALMLFGLCSLVDRCPSVERLFEPRMERQRRLIQERRQREHNERFKGLREWNREREREYQRERERDRERSNQISEDMNRIRAESEARRRAANGSDKP